MANTQATAQIAAESGCVCPPNHPPSLVPPPGWKAYPRCDGSRYYHNEADRVTTSCEMSVPGHADAMLALLKIEVEIRRDHCEQVDIHIESPGNSVSEWVVIHIDHDGRMARKRASNCNAGGDVSSAPYKTDAPEKLHSHPASVSTSHPGGTSTGSSSASYFTAISMFDSLTQVQEELLYWHYVRLHPNHIDLDNPRQNVHNILLWCRDERALCSDADVPFSQDESETFLKYLDGYDERHASGKNLVRQNCLVAALMERVVNFRHHRTATPSVSPFQLEILRRETVEKPDDSWLTSLLYFFFVMVLFLGQPHTYRRRLGRIERFEPSHAIDTLHWQAFIGAFVTEWEHANILATVMISATVGFLAVPGLDDISRILGIISVLDAICSGLIGMVYVWHHGPRIKTTAALGRLYIKHGSHFFGMHSPVLFACTLAIPVVLLWWSFLSFVGAVLVYAFRGQQVDAMGQMVNFSITTKFTSLVAFIFGVGSGAAGYVVMWQVWKPISEPWARLGSDPEDRSGRAKKGQSSTSQSS